MKSRAILLLVGIIVTILQSGCVFSPPMISGAPISEENIHKIKSKVTTKSDLLNIIGPPYAILAKDRMVKAQHGREWMDLGRGFKPVGFDTLDSNSCLALFSDNNAITDDHRIYYYYYSKSSKTAYILLLAIYERIDNSLERLYVLVNERTKIVDDFYYRVGY